MYTFLASDEFIFIIILDCLWLCGSYVCGYVDLPLRLAVQALSLEFKDCSSFAQTFLWLWIWEVFKKCLCCVYIYEFIVSPLINSSVHLHQVYQSTFHTHNWFLAQGVQKYFLLSYLLENTIVQSPIPYFCLQSHNFHCSTALYP